MLFILYDHSAYALITFAAALLHECGHLLMMKWRSVTVESVTIHFFGADIKKTRAPTSYMTDLIVSCGGILANLTAIIIALPFSLCPEISFFIFCNMALAAVNALPIHSLDGGEALISVLLMLLPPAAAFRVMHVISFIFLLMLWFTAVYALMFCNGNISLFLICVYLFGSIFLSNHGDYI